MEKRSVVILGSGNVATHLARAIDALPHYRVAVVYSRNAQHALRLAAQLNDASTCTDLSALPTDAHLYLIALADDAIETLHDSMPKVSGTLAHTSGSIPMAAIEGLSNYIGVLYPLQTFSREMPVDVADVPFFIEANDLPAYNVINDMAQALSRQPVNHADSHQRSILHLAAVFACNFSTYMCGTAADLLEDKGYSFDVFKPLMQVTFNKILNAPASNPHNIQTGPAMRGDLEVISKQIDMLAGNDRDLYRMTSQAIIDRHNKNM